MKKLSMVLLIMSICAAVMFTGCGSKTAEGTQNSGSASQEIVSKQESAASSDAGGVASDKETSEESKNDSAEESAQETSKTGEDSSVPDSSESTVEESAVPEDSEEKTLVVYFSATGTTKGVAETIADVTNGDLFEIVPAQAYSDEDLDWNDKNSRTTIETADPNCRPEIANNDISFDGYSTVYIGYPIWWGDAPRIMSTFVESHSFDGLTVIPFCTSGGSGIGRSGENLAEQAGSGNWLGGDRLNAGASEDEILNWINGLQ